MGHSWSCGAHFRGAEHLRDLCVLSTSVNQTLKIHLQQGEHLHPDPQQCTTPCPGQAPLGAAESSAPGATSAPLLRLPTWGPLQGADRDLQPTHLMGAEMLPLRGLCYGQAAMSPGLEMNSPAVR